MENTLISGSVWSSPGWEIPSWLASTQQAQLRKDRIARVNDAVAVAAILGLVKLGQSEKAIRMLRGGLWRKVTEQFLATGDDSAAITIKRQEGVLAPRNCPRDLNWVARPGDIKAHTVVRIGKKETITRQINDY